MAFQQLVYIKSFLPQPKKRLHFVDGKSETQRSIGLQLETSETFLSSGVAWSRYKCEAPGFARDRISM